MFSKIADCLEGQHAFLFFVFTAFLDELQRDGIPVAAHVVAMKHHHISILDVKLNAGYVLHTD
jgi:hypothetical protein